MDSRTQPVDMAPFAIIGLSFKLPGGAVDEHSFWQTLEERKNLSTSWKAERYDLSSFARSESLCQGAHFLNEDPGLFDAPFFSIPPKDAAAMDPQQRMALEVAYHAFENAGLKVENLRGSATAVVGATMSTDYATMTSKDVDTALPQSVTGDQPAILPNRVSWHFDLHGPSLHVDTACSGSMVAIDLACQSMRNGSAKMALVIGSNLLLSPESTRLLNDGKFLSPDGKCFSFDARANGYARGEGIVALVVKPLYAALEDGDIIRAVIRGTGSNQDGRTPTLTQPNADSQEALMRRVYATAGLDFADTRYFEAHGTGTAVGDPIELSAIGKVFGPSRQSDQPLLVGSVKANIGHLEGGSGAAGIVKSILALEKGIIPPNALFEKWNPNIDADFYKLKVPVESTPWPSAGLRRVSVNSFGYGGTNSHIILDDSFNYLKDQRLTGFHHCNVDPVGVDGTTLNGATYLNDAGSDTDSDRGPRDQPNPEAPVLLTWSAADPGALSRMTEEYQEYYDTHIAGNAAKIEQLAYTLTARRSLMPWRTFTITTEQPDQSTTEPNRFRFAQAVRAPASTSNLAFAFTGQGAQYVDMGLQLLKYPSFKNSLTRSNEILSRLGCTWSIFDEIRNEQHISLPEYSQPICTALQIALVELLSSFGIEPTAVVGHSSGEIAAAAATGAISHESACKIAYFRGLATEEVRQTIATQGAMMVVNMSESDAQTYLEQRGISPQGAAVCIACVNSPTNVTLSGPAELIASLKDGLDISGHFAVILKTGVAYHSPAMGIIAERYASIMECLDGGMVEQAKTKEKHMISSVTGQLVGPKQLLDPQYWVKNLVSPVRFLDAIQRLTDDASRQKNATDLGTISDVIEVGPHAALRRSVKEAIPSIRYHSVLERGKSPLHTSLALLGALFCHGYQISVLAGNLQESSQLPFLVDCPKYPFDHSRRYWHESRLSKDVRLRPRSQGYMLGKRAQDWNDLLPHWRSFLCKETRPWLGDHVISNATLCPGAVMVVMAIEAVREVVAAHHSNISGYLIKEARLLAPIIVGETFSEATESVLYLRPVHNSLGKEARWFDISIFTYRDGKWAQCFHADVEVQLEGSNNTQVDGGHEGQLWQESIRQSHQEAGDCCKSTLAKSDFYQFCSEHGIQYGEAFQLLQNIAWNGLDRSTARIDMTAMKQEFQEEQNSLHPTLLDAAIHLVMSQISNGFTQNIPTLVPKDMSNIWISANPWKHGTSSVHLASTLATREEGTTSLKASFHALADDGSLLCAANQVTLSEVSRQMGASQEPSRGVALHRIDWKPQMSSLSSSQLLDWCNHAACSFDEAFEIGWMPKAEKAMRLAALRATKIVSDADLERGPRYMGRFMKSLKKLYGKPCTGDEAITDATLDSLMDSCEAELPECGVFMQIARKLPLILTGDADPLELMFATKSAEALYTHLAAKQFRDGRFAQFLDLISHELPTLKILEVGAGTGSVSRHILGTLQRFENETGQSRFIQYTYTDISPMFFEAADQEFGNLQGRVTYKTLDLERDPVEQGFELGSYDLIVAGLVFHATTNLTKTMTHVRQLLKPRGYLAFQEVDATESACANVTFGALEGWWLSEEDWRQDTPLLTWKGWDAMLLETGFSGADLVLRDYDNDDCHLCSMIVSHAVDVTTLLPDGTSHIGSDAKQQLYIFVQRDSDHQVTLAQSLSHHFPDAQVLDQAYGSSGAWVPQKHDIVVSLLEVGTSKLSTLTEVDFQQLQSLLEASHNFLSVSGAVERQNAGDMCDPHCAVATGFLRALQSEAPDKHLVSLLVDSNYLDRIASSLEHILDTCFMAPQRSSETEFILRDGYLTIGRLMEDIPLDQERSSRVIPQLYLEPWKAGPPLRLEVGTPGMLDTFRFVEDQIYHTELHPKQVELEATAWPICFRDVFVALGRMDMKRLGIECAGTVTRVGDACSGDFVPGDRVVAISLGCMRSHPRACSDLVAKVPGGMSLNEAAAAINPGITAYHALVNVARLDRGEKILIHSGAGSTGQMAIGIAQWLGAEVFATVGYDDKKKLLMDRFGIPADHIFYSRNTSFAKGVMRMTNDYGVDVILNSLSGEGLKASWECIAPYGRFVEIGKADIISNSSLPMSCFAKNTSFAAVDLVHILESRPKLITQMMKRLLDLLSQGIISGPDPLHIFGLPDVEKAFRLMQSGTNTGRIILNSYKDDLVQKFVTLKSSWDFDPVASYVVAGGFGGIGRAILTWMVGRGAKNLIVPSRSGASTQAALAIIGELAGRGVRVMAPRCDAASSDDLAALLHNCTTDMPPIKGCINAAMVLQDSVFENMSYTQWSTTIQSKVATSWNLHSLLPQDMDFFIMLSSIAGVCGSPGQSNYAAGCSFQDALARYRSATGCRGSVSVDIGRMRNIGIIAETEEYRRKRHDGAHMYTVEEPDFFALLEHYCDPCLGVLHTDHSQVQIGMLTPAYFLALGETPHHIFTRPLFAGFNAPHLHNGSGKNSAVSTQVDVAALFQQATTPAERSAIVVEAIAAKLARTLEVAPEQIDPHDSLSHYGTDSLMAVELRNWIRRDFRVGVAVFEIMGGASIMAIGDLVARKADEE